MIRYSKKHDIQCVVMGGTTFENVSFNVNASMSHVMPIIRIPICRVFMEW